MNRKSKRRQRGTSYQKLENRNLLAADLSTVCFAPEVVDHSPAEDVSVVTDAMGNSTESPIVAIAPSNFVNDTISVTDISIGDGTSSRSMINELQLTFDDIVDPTSEALTLTLRETGEHVDLAWTIDNSSGVSVLTVTFSGALTQSGGSLVDGNYSLQVEGDFFGGESPGNDFEFGNEETDNFFRFFGDTDGDRDNDIFNLLAMRKTYLHSSPEPEYNAQLDFNQDDKADIFDLLAYRKNYRERLEWV